MTAPGSGCCMWLSCCCERIYVIICNSIVYVQTGSRRGFDVAKRTIASTKLTEGDELIFVGASDEMEQIVLQSEGGYFLRFQKQDVSTVKKTSIGVRGMKLAEGDRLAHAYLLESRQEYTITHHDKPYTLNKIKLAKRDSKGTKPRI